MTDANGERAALPRQCGKYLLLEAIGSGGMAEVYLAKLPGIAGFEKTVVVKKLHARYAHQQEFVQLFVEEAKLAAEVQHKNVVSVYELGSQDNGEVFMAMEYVAGTDLKNLLRHCNQTGHRLPPWLTLYVVSEALEALSYAHGLTDAHGRPRNIVHCDVTPENIFLSHIGEVKLGDFGVAQDDARTSEPFPGQLKGKVPYMSPEQVQGVRPDQRSDIFAVGIVLWECLTQRRLFSGKSVEETMRRLIRAPRIPPSHFSPDIPPELDALVLGALEVNPDHRIPTARAMQARVVEILEALQSRHPLAAAREALGSLLPEAKQSATRDLRVVQLERSDEVEDTHVPAERDVAAAEALAMPVAPQEVSAARPPPPPPKSVTAPRAPPAAHTHPYLRSSRPGSGAFSRPVLPEARAPSRPPEPAPSRPPPTELVLESERPTDQGVKRTLEPDQAHQTWLALGGDPLAPPPRMPPRRSSSAPFARTPPPAPGHADEERFTYGIVNPKNAVDRLGPAGDATSDLLPRPSMFETQDILRSQPERVPSVAPRRPPASHLPGAPVPAEPPPRIDSSPARHPLWVRGPEGLSVGPHGPAEALELLVSALDSASPDHVAVSADGLRWLSATHLATLLGEEQVSGEPLADAPHGDLAERSLASVFAELGAAGTSGRLAIERDGAHGPTRWELALDDGRLVGVASNTDAFEVWTHALAGNERRHELRACLYGVIAQAMPLTAVAAPADRDALRPHQVRVMQGHLHRLFGEDGGRFGMIVSPRPSNGIGAPIDLIRLLPAVVSRARRSAELRELLLPHLSVAMVRSETFERDAAALGLKAPDLERLAPFGHGYTLEQSLSRAGTARDAKLALVLAYLLLELGLLSPYYARQGT